MHRLILPVLMAAPLVLAGCSGGGDEGQAPEPASTSSATATSSEDYADTVIEAFRETRPTGTEYYDVPASDWKAFVSVIEDLTPPEGAELAHERMVAGFDAYAEQSEQAEETCKATPGPGGPCYVAVSDASDLWTAALDRAYAIPGLSYNSLIG